MKQLGVYNTVKADRELWPQINMQVEWIREKREADMHLYRTEKLMSAGRLRSRGGTLEVGSVQKVESPKAMARPQAAKKVDSPFRPTAAPTAVRSPISPTSPRSPSSPDYTHRSPPEVRDGDDLTLTRRKSAARIEGLEGADSKGSKTIRTEKAEEAS